MASVENNLDRPMYYKLKIILFTYVLLMLIVLYLLKHYDIVGQAESHRGCSTYNNIHCEYCCAF
jgi:uncharacterized membrane protein (UPF0182 family)